MVVGLATVLTLVSTVTFGYLTYYFQNIDGERFNLYVRFNEEVRYLREGLDSLEQDGLIDRSYRKALATMEAIVRFSSWQVLG